MLAKGYSKTTNKQFTGIEKQPNKKTHMHNTIWAFAITMAEGYNKTTSKLFIGFEKQLSKEMFSHRSI